MIKMTVTSAAFEDNGMIPSKYTCEGLDLSPPLAWSGPQGTKAWAVTCLDPDAPAGTWTHWILFNLPGGLRSLEEGLTARNSPNGSAFGSNSWNRAEYGGPCPPSGTHRYFFTVHALKDELPLQHGATLKELNAAMENLVLTRGSLMGFYERK